MAQILGAKKLHKEFNRLASKAGKSGDVIVGYTANYAVHVHENAKAEARRRLRAKGAGEQQWKFLEQPLREFTKELIGIVATVVKRGGTLLMGLKAAGTRLQAESQRIVPVDTGNLKGSAFTKEE